MVKLTVLGVCPLSDFYPGIKYRLPLLRELYGSEYRELITASGGATLYQQASSRSFLPKLGFVIRLAVLNLWLFLRYLVKPSEKVYLCYPAVPLGVLFALLPRAWRPQIYLDGFISLYDSTVLDRGLLQTSSVCARLLFKLESMAFRVADRVLVDTQQNASWYSQQFHLPLDRFIPVPLSIPFGSEQRIPYNPGEGEFICTFMGSLVPLQGIQVIVQAAQLLTDLPDLEFVLIGSGQDAYKIQQVLSARAHANIHWQQQLLPTREVVERLQQASLCLGIFGETAKVQRVLPYKLYYYMALGLPFVTLSTPAIREVIDSDRGLNLVTVQPGPRALAQQIRRFYNSRSLLSDCAALSAGVFDNRLAAEHIRRRLQEVFNMDNFSE